MKNQHHIIDKYRTADVERRLALFLEWPDFRKDFIAIETNEASSGVARAKRQHFLKRIFINLGVFFE